MNHFKIKIFPNQKAAGEFVAQNIIDIVHNQNNVNLGLATGSTPIKIYEALIKDYKDNKTNYQNVCSFNLDEYYPINKNDINSYYHYMYTNLFNHINISSKNVYFPELETNFDDLIKKHQGIDLQILGIGLNGHIGFNEPNTSLDSITRLVDLTPSTIDANKKYFSDVAKMPTQAISMGLATILEAKKIILVIFGKSKSQILKQLLNLNKFDLSIPASCLYLHNDVTIILDQEAGYDL